MTHSRDVLFIRLSFFLVWAAPLGAVPASFTLNEADAVLKNDILDDRFDETSYRFDDWNRHPAVGDFDGDGYGDLAVIVNGPSRFEVLLVPGELTFRSGMLTDRSRLRIQLPPNPPAAYPPSVGRTDRVALGDMNGDGRAELVISHLARVYVYNGRSWPTPGTLWDETQADIRLEGMNHVQGLALGDVTGDGRSDIVFQGYDSTGGSTFIHEGRQEPSPTVYAQGVSTPSFADARIVKHDYGDGRYPKIGDVNGDGVGDIGLNPHWPLYQLTTRIQFVWGSDSLPTLRDFNTTPPPLTLQARTAMGLDLVGLCDVDNDGRADVVAQDAFVSSSVYLWRGVDVVAQSSIDAGSASQRYALLPQNPLPLDGFGCADMDGDGRKDLMLGNAALTYLFLSSQGSFDNWLTGGGLSTAITVVGQHGGSALGDVDGDGLADLWLFDFYGLAGTVSSSYSSLFLFNGYHPLANPRLTLDPRGEGEARVTARLSVDGSPTEMRFTGDVAEPVSGTWVPYAPQRRLTLSSGTGDKRVAVTFRNRLGRISETVETSTRLQPSGRGLRAVTNRIRPGERARFEVQKVDGGTLTAWVETTGGTRVQELSTGNSGDGVEMVEWDGRDASGRPVAPGVYHLRLRHGDQRETRRILVVP
jgi:hypothetical protein